MTGRQEVARIRQRTDAAFARARALDPSSDLHADLAKHLCILVSGFVENSVYELLVHFAKSKAHEYVANHTAVSLDRLTNVDSRKLLRVCRGFSEEWENALTAALTPERQAALNSLVRLRNRVAHGEWVGASLSQVADYYRLVQPLIDTLAEQTEPKIGLL